MLLYLVWSFPHGCGVFCRCFFFFFGYLEGLCRYRLALVCLPIVFVCSISSYFSPLLEKRSCIM